MLGDQAGAIVLLAEMTQLGRTCDIRGTDRAVHEFLEAFRADTAIAASLAGIANERHRFLWSGDGNEFRIGDPSGADLLARTHDTYIVLDLEAMGTRIARRAGRPLMMIKLPSEPGA